MKQKVYIAVFFLFFYLYMQTGMHSDDYSNAMRASTWDIWQLLTLDRLQAKSWLNYIPSLYFDFFQIYFFKFNPLAYEISKIVTSFASFYLFFLFLQTYLEFQKAVALSLLVILYPTHDATQYWFIGQYIMVNFAIVVFSHRLVHQERFKTGFGVGLLGAFWSYASPAFNLGLSLIFLIKKEYKKFIVFILPEIMYIVYYLVVSKLYGTTDFRTKDMLNIFSLIKQFFLQIGTYIDIAIGPSFWLKLYYAITQIGMLSFILGLILVYGIYRLYDFKKEPFNWTLFIAFSAIAVIAFGMFAITGYFPQIAFNLGNRVTFFGSIVLAFLIVSLLSNKKIGLIVLSLYTFSILGISDHWKEWNHNQVKIIDNIKNNALLKDLDDSEIVFVSYNQYSQLGAISHIEFFGENYVVNTIFDLAYDNTSHFKSFAINKRYLYQNGEMIDKKYNIHIPIKEYIYIYDSSKNELNKITRNKINDYIETLPEDNRHWVQLLDKDNVILQIALKLMPRLQYAL